MKNFQKREPKKENVVIFIAGMAMAALFSVTRRDGRMLCSLSDFLFVMGTVHMVPGAVRYIRNVGLFKTFSYLSYRRRWKSSGPAPYGVRPMSLAEYTVNVVMDETRQRPCGYLLGMGFAFWLLSLLSALAAQGR